MKMGGHYNKCCSVRYMLSDSSASFDLAAKYSIGYFHTSSIVVQETNDPKFQTLSYCQL
jgi:hypothetical protein